MISPARQTLETDDLPQRACLSVQIHVHSGYLNFEPSNIPDRQATESRDLIELHKRKSLAIQICSQLDTRPNCTLCA